MGMSSVTKAAVITIINNLQPVVAKVKTTSQGSRDKNSLWSIARWLFANQFLIRLCEHDSQEITIYQNTFVPDYWNTSKLAAINLSQIAWWDETHRRCSIGGIGGRKFYLKFPRDANEIFN
jgi:hypothetical protein